MTKLSIEKAIALLALTLAVAGCAATPNSVTQTANERSACAELGLDPGSAEFAGCVGDLDATITGYMSGANH